MKSRIIKLFITFIKFGSVGVFNTAFSFFIYYILIYLNIDPIISNATGYIISSMVGYLLNKFWVFKSLNNNNWITMIKYYVVYLSSLLINIISTFLWVQIFCYSKFTVPLFTLGLTIPYNFLLSRYWVFNKEK